MRVNVVSDVHGRTDALRDAADAYVARTGQRPQVFLANLGEIVEHNRRSTWMWNFLAAGGIEGLTSDGYADGAAAAQAFKTSGANIACLCSSDEIYAQKAKAAAAALKAAGLLNEGEAREQPSNPFDPRRIITSTLRSVGVLKN